MNKRPWVVALLLFSSGTCALVYQVAWLREFRLIFGASTAAAAAVLAIFMGGLGVGGVLLGRRVDRLSNPLRFYAQLELLIAISAALTPALIWLSRYLYIMLGGSVTLGLTVATVLRLILSALVLAVPTILMGGTLPAAARSIETDDDPARRRLAILYGANTLGAVTGALLTTFVLLEALGTHAALWASCLLNLIVGGVAWWLSRGKEPSTVIPAGSSTKSPQPQTKPNTRGEASTHLALPPRFTLALAGVVGFAFFLLEIVWYRMLAPLLGGTTYTFGLILAVALFGIGLGGAAYAFIGRGRAVTIGALATTCAVESLFVAIPFALGDRLAIMAALLRPLGSTGFLGSIIGWSLVTCVIVLPVAFVAGIQFPLLIALLGQGRRDVGRHTGAAYAWNTGGAILGSLAGGFFLLPILGALGTWRAIAVLLSIFAIATAFLSIRSEKRWLVPIPSTIAAVVAIVLLFTTGPTSAWRHSSIGAGRANFPDTRNEIRDWVQKQRRAIQWTAEGVESNMGVTNSDGLAFLINGKSDGNAKLDAPTAVMHGIIAGILHPNPKNVLVVGLGTGTTAGWLAAIPSVERLDVVELEPAVEEFARQCSAVNQNVFSNPEVHFFTGDAREVLLTTSQRYDLIISEPSNPYRAGLASLFSQEFYEAVTARLNPDGILVQFVQGYEIDVTTLRLVYATFSSVFHYVETWQSAPYDMMFVCTTQPIHYDVPALRRRIQEEPFRSALLNTWRAIDLEGVLARFVANGEFALVSGQGKDQVINTDDRNPLEYAFARTLGQDYAWSINDVKTLARQRRMDRPVVIEGDVDWARVDDERVCMYVGEGITPLLDENLSPEQRYRAEALQHIMKGNTRGVLAGWQRQERQPSNPTELAIIAFSLADHGDSACLPYAEQLRRYQPAEADAIIAHLMLQQWNLDKAVESLERTFKYCTTVPWSWSSVINGALGDAVTIARQERGFAPRLAESLKRPFAVYVLNEARNYSVAAIAPQIDASACVGALQAFEPNVPWTREFLTTRMQFYEAADDSRAADARRDLDEFLKYEPLRPADLLTPRGN